MGQRSCRGSQRSRCSCARCSPWTRRGWGNGGSRRSPCGCAWKRRHRRTQSKSSTWTTQKRGRCPSLLVDRIRLVERTKATHRRAQTKVLRTTFMCVARLGLLQDRALGAAVRGDSSHSARALLVSAAARCVALCPSGPLTDHTVDGAALSGARWAYVVACANHVRMAAPVHVVAARARGLAPALVTLRMLGGREGQEAQAEHHCCGGGNSHLQNRWEPRQGRGVALTEVTSS